jgi:hypothetical protein
LRYHVYYCKIDLYCTTGSCDIWGCTCNSQHISPDLSGEAGESPSPAEEVEQCQISNTGFSKGPERVKVSQEHTEFIGFCSHTSSDLGRYLSDVREGWEDGSLVEVLLSGLFS